jgi:hypothetical protein
MNNNRTLYQHEYVCEEQLLDIGRNSVRKILRQIEYKATNHVSLNPA